MATLNVWMGIGRLGKDPEELKVTGDGKPYIQFSLAVDQGKSDTMWLNVTAWEKTAGVVEKSARKGTLVFVQGKLQMKKYKDKTTQAERLSVEISASNVQILEKSQRKETIYPTQCYRKSKVLCQLRIANQKITEHPIVSRKYPHWYSITCGTSLLKG